MGTEFSTDAWLISFEHAIYKLHVVLLSTETILILCKRRYNFRYTQIYPARPTRHFIYWFTLSRSRYWRITITICEAADEYRPHHPFRRCPNNIFFFLHQLRRVQGPHDKYSWTSLLVLLLCRVPSQVKPFMSARCVRVCGYDHYMFMNSWWPRRNPKVKNKLKKGRRREWATALQE